MNEVLLFLSSRGYRFVWSERCNAYLVYGRDSKPRLYVSSAVLRVFKQFGYSCGVGFDYNSGCIFIRIVGTWRD